MDCRDRIKKSLKVLSTEKKEQEISLSSPEDMPHRASSFRQKLKKIPLLGKILWYLYGIAMAPLRIRNLTNENNALKDRQNFIEKSLDSVERELDIIEESLDSVKRELDFLRSDLAFRYDTPEEYKIVKVPEFIKRENLEKIHDFYRLFEESFRGQDIEARLQKYLPFVEDAVLQISGEGFFLDVGCGRGEFLNLLSSRGISVKGVELNKEYAELLKERNFDVHYGDAIEYLKSIPDNSLIGISAIHVIEHLDFERLRQFVALVYKKIMKDGVMIVETPNPKCSVALANFYIDFTHIRPYPYELVLFLLEEAGFKDMKLILSSPVERSFRTGNPLGDYMDYGIVGYKR